MPTIERECQDVSQRLSLLDYAMHSVDRSVRKMDSPGFETQTLVWLDGRLDTARLRATIAGLSTCHPLMTSRLGQNQHSGLCWTFRPGAECPLQEIDLPSAEDESVWEEAGRLMSMPQDPAHEDPVRFHILHRPNGRDVFLMHYNHALMDNRSSVLLLQEINRLTAGPTRVVPPDEDHSRDLVREYLLRFSRQERRQALVDTMRLWARSIRGGVITLGRRHASERRPVQVRIATRSIGAREAGLLRASVLKTCGYPSVSMALLGSVFRVLGQIAPEQWSGGRNFLAGIGVDLGLRRQQGPIFQNLMSVVPIHARTEDIEDRDNLIRMLSRQLRQRLDSRADLGLLQWVRLARTRPRQDVDWEVDYALRHAFSLWYAHFGSLDAIGSHFCGAAIEEAFYIGPTWPALGLTLLVNQFRGRLLLQATYIPDVVPESLAAAFLDRVAADVAG